MPSTSNSTIKRANERGAITKAILETRNLHIYGNRGQSKTYTTKKAASNTDKPHAYIDCRRHKTTTQILTQIYNQTAPDPLEKRTHEDQIKAKLDDLLTPDNTVILDDIDFARNPDHIITWINEQTPATITTISSNTGDLTQLTDDQTVARLQPYHVHFQDYTQTDTVAILNRIAAKTDVKATKRSLSNIAVETANLDYAALWLITADEHSDDIVTEHAVHQSQQEARIRYENQQLAPLSKHHHIVLEAINELTDPVKHTVTTSTVQDQYRDICDVLDEDARSNRRVTTYIDHLDLLGLIRVDKHNGGETGKTREIRLQQL